MVEIISDIISNAYNGLIQFSFFFLLLVTLKTFTQLVFRAPERNMLTIGALDALFNSKLKLTISFTLNQIAFKATIDDDDKNEQEMTCIRDWHLRSDFEFK